MLHLIPESKVLLTAETRVADPTDATRQVVRGVLCDLNGKPLADGQQAVETYLDSYTGDRYAKVCEVLPTNADPVSVQKRKDILALKGLEHYQSPDNVIRGYFAPSPDYTLNGIHPGSKRPAAGGAFPGPPVPPPAA